MSSSQDTTNVKWFDKTVKSQISSIKLFTRLNISGLNLTWATLHFVGWVEHTLSFVGFRFTLPNLHFISSIAQCETQQRPILEPSPE